MEHNHKHSEQAEQTENSWSEILSDLNTLNLAHNDELSLLITVIEADLLGQTDDFSVTVSGHSVTIKAGEEDRLMRDKLKVFIEALKKTSEALSQEPRENIKKTLLTDRQTETGMQDTSISSESEILPKPLTPRPSQRFLMLPPPAQTLDTISKATHDFRILYQLLCKSCNEEAVQLPRSGEYVPLQLGASLRTIIDKKLGTQGQALTDLMPTRIHTIIFGDYAREMMEVLYKIQNEIFKKSYTDFCRRTNTDPIDLTTFPRILNILSGLMRALGSASNNSHIRDNMDDEIDQLLSKSRLYVQIFLIEAVMQWFLEEEGL